MNRLKLIIIAICCYLFVACTPSSDYTELKSITHYNDVRTYYVDCIDGVEYIIIIAAYDSTALSPHYKQDGTLFTCELD